MAGSVLVVASSAPPPAEAAALASAALDGLGARVLHLDAGKLDGPGGHAATSGTEPPLILLLPDLPRPLAVGRQLHRAYPQAHLLFVQQRENIHAFRQGLGLAPRLGRHWSVVEADAALLAGASRQALSSLRQRRQLRTTLTAVNERMAQPREAGNEYQRMVASEHHLANFLRYSNAAVFGLDADAKVLFWSPGAAELVGVSASDALGKPLQGLGRWAEPVMAALGGARSPTTVEAVVELGGETRVLEAVLSPPTGPAAGHVGASVVLRDVTARRRAQEQLREANLELQRLVSSRTQELEKSQLALVQAQKLEAVGQLTGGVAHDFNNVLQVIGSNLQLLQAAVQDAPGAARLLRAALDAVDRGAKLASQLLAFARRQPLNPLPLNISRRVADMGDLLRRALGESVEIETVLSAGLWTTLADANQLENVILNLAINARDAMPGGGKLTIETANVVFDDQYAQSTADLSPGQYVMVAVSDTGTGMPPDVVARAFEPFFTTKPPGQGTGLGLSMAYGFAKQSGGHIRIYSEPGNGTTIKLYLPRSHEKEIVLPAPQTGPLKGGTESILVVEDDLAVQAAVVNMLQSLGYRVLRANDAQAALSILQSGVHVDLLFTDVVMPGPLRSPELAQRAKALIPDIAVLFTSGYTQNAIVHGGRLDPGVELLSKPYRQEDLARRVRQVLGRRPPAVAPSPSAPAPAASATGAHTASRLRVLLAEDQADLRETSLQLLDLLGCDADGAADAEAAEKLLAQRTYDVLITDVSLPGRSGVELARAVVQQHPHVKIVFCSGYGAPTDWPAALPRAWNLPKPYDLPQLQSLLDELRN